MREFIVRFLDVKKEDFLQSKIASEEKKKKKELDDNAREKIRLEHQEEANAKYNLETWIENIIRKVKPNVTTHPAKFTNAKIDTDTAQIFLGKFQEDGYLKTGNIYLKNKVDVSGNSATNTMVYELYELLDTHLSDTQKFIDKFKEDDTTLIEVITQLNGDYEYIKNKCLKVYYGETSQIQTHETIRQVYFPIFDNNYHLLSIKTASMLMYEMKNRIDKMNVWVDGVHARSFKKDNKYLEGGFSEIYGITEIGFSHSDFLKMGNYSYLNVKNRGIAYLLPSEPPKIENRSVRLPKTDFFTQCLYYKNFQESFIQLHKLMQLKINNIDIRTAIQNIINFIIDKVLFEAYKIREHEIYESGWSNQDYYSGLPKIQKIWLDNLYQKEREDSDEWRDELSIDIARWILQNYEKTIHNYFTLGDGELIEVNKFVKKMVKEDKEYF